ncbi:MAG TPA: hypothetical protein VMV49_10055 [Candidatus Deferrimicrobium sp.]|nr:hypothetical protein [Candidatus Deferrimicrobium sp.]
MTTERIECFLCGKMENAETMKKSLSFYVNWIEYLPGKWMCRACKETKHDKNLIKYKFQLFFNDSNLPK